MKRIFNIISAVLLCCAISCQPALARGRNNNNANTSQSNNNNSSRQSQQVRATPQRSQAAREVVGGRVNNSHGATPQKSSYQAAPNKGNGGISSRPGNNGQGNNQGITNPGNSGRPTTNNNNNTGRPGNNGLGNNNSFGPSNNNFGPGNNGNNGVGNGNNGNRPGNGNNGPGNGNNGNRPGNGNNGFGPGNNGNRPGNGNNGFGPGNNGNRPGNGNNGFGPGNNCFGPGHPGNNRPQNIGQIPNYRPHRPMMPAVVNFSRPVPPATFRPGPGGPNFGTILGIALGSAINMSLNYLLNSGYYVTGYTNNAVYLNYVYMLNMMWPNTTLYYNNGMLMGSEFVYSTPFYNLDRYYSTYNILQHNYGMPVNNLRLSGGGIQTTWFGEGGRYVTLQFNTAIAYDGQQRYYTTLSFGN